MEGTHIRGEYREPGLRHPNGNSVGRPSPPTSSAEQQQAERISQKANQLKQQYQTYAAILAAKKQRTREVIDALNADPQLELTLDNKEELAAYEKATVELQTNNKVIVTDVYIQRTSVAAGSPGSISMNFSTGGIGGGASISIPGGRRNAIEVITNSVDTSRGRLVNVDKKVFELVLSPSQPETLLGFPQIGLQTAAKRLYVCAEGGGGDVVNANRSQIREWETFTMLNYNSEHLQSSEVHHGDKVCFVTYKGFYMRSNPDGGMAIEAGHPGNLAPGDWEPFTIESKSGVAGPLEDLEEVFIRDFLGRLLIADHGGGGGIHKSTNPGLHETFILCKGPKGLDPQRPHVWSPGRSPL